MHFYSLLEGGEVRVTKVLTPADPLIMPPVGSPNAGELSTRIVKYPSAPKKRSHAESVERERQEAAESRNVRRRLF
jgi:hypothetical protein